VGKKQHSNTAKSLRIKKFPTSKNHPREAIKKKKGLNKTCAVDASSPKDDQWRRILSKLNLKEEGRRSGKPVRVGRSHSPARSSPLTIGRGGSGRANFGGKRTRKEEYRRSIAWDANSGVKREVRSASRGNIIQGEFAGVFSEKV